MHPFVAYINLSSLPALRTSKFHPIHLSKKLIFTKTKQNNIKTYLLTNIQRHNFFGTGKLGRRNFTSIRSSDIINLHTKPPNHKKETLTTPKKNPKSTRKTKQNQAHTNSYITLLYWTKHLKSTDQAVKSKTRTWIATSPPRTIKASTMSMLGTTVTIQIAYKIANGKISKRHGHFFFLIKSTLSTTFPPTLNLNTIANQDRIKP